MKFNAFRKLKAGKMLSGTLLVVLAQSALAQPLSGTYTVGGVGADYSSISAAAIALVINGVNGPTVFEIADGTYTEQVLFSEYPGASSTNTVTFRSASMDSTSVIVKYTGTSPNLSYVMQVDGADFLTIEHLTIRPTGTDYRNGLSLKGEINGLNIRNNFFEGQLNGGNLIFWEPVSGTKTNIAIVKNRFLNGENQVIMNSGTSGSVENIEIGNNVFEGIAGRSILLQHCKYAWIHGNVLQGLRLEYEGGIFVRLEATGLLIEHNKMVISFDPVGWSILELEYSSATVSEPAIVRNNSIICMDENNGGTCVRVVTSNNLKFFNNSFLNNSDGAVVSIADDFHDNFDFRNNILASKQQGRILSFGEYVDTSAFRSDHNCFFGYSTEPFRLDTSFNTSIVTDFAGWKNITGSDQHSVFTDPQFLSETDIHINAAGALNGAGQYTPYVTIDIDGEARGNPPDIGADEFELDSAYFYDLALDTALYLGQDPCALLDSIRIRVANNSSFAIDTFVLQYWIFETLMDSVVIYRNMPPYSMNTFNLGAYNFNSNTGYNLYFEISAPNGMVDGNSSNNTAYIEYWHLGEFEIREYRNEACTEDILLFIPNFRRNSMLWSNGSSDQEILISNTGLYSIIVEDEFGCVEEDEILINQ